MRTMATKTLNLDPRDAIPEGMCMKCGMTGRHETAEECIAGLRDRIARLEFTRKHAGETRLRHDDIPRHIAG